MASAFPIFLIFFLWITSAFSSSVALKTPKLGLVRESKHGKFSMSQSNLNEISSSGYKFYNYSQMLDHFNYQPESYAIFQQRYAINDKYWGGAKNNSPIFVYTGDEASLESVISSAGFLVDNAPHFQALLVVIENIKSVLKKFGSNIIFSNGLRDPYSSGGVLCNISDTIVAIYTTQGSHCLDIIPATATDPEWLIAQRNEEIKIIERWIAEYKANIIA